MPPYTTSVPLQFDGFGLTEVLISQLPDALDPQIDDQNQCPGPWGSGIKRLSRASTHIDGVMTLFRFILVIRKSLSFWRARKP